MDIPFDTPVSMNMWGFSHSIMEELQKAVDKFFDTEVEQNPLKSVCAYGRLLGYGAGTHNH